MDWKDCCRKKIVKEVNAEREMINALIKASNNKLSSEKQLYMSPTTASSKLSLAYDSLRELLEALALQESFKIYNHECYTAFLKEIVKESYLGDEFEEIRKVRNAVNYYGKDISVSETEDIIKKVIQLRELIFLKIKP